MDRRSADLNFGVEFVIRIPDNVVGLLKRKAREDDSVMSFLRILCHPANIWIPSRALDSNMNTERKLMVTGESQDVVDRARLSIWKFIREEIGVDILQMNPLIQEQIALETPWLEMFESGSVSRQRSPSPEASGLRCDVCAINLGTKSSLTKHLQTKAHLRKTNAVGSKHQEAGAAPNAKKEIKEKSTKKPSVVKKHEKYWCVLCQIWMFGKPVVSTHLRTVHEEEDCEVVMITNTGMLKVTKEQFMPEEKKNMRSMSPPSSKSRSVRSRPSSPGRQCVKKKKLAESSLPSDSMIVLSAVGKCDGDEEDIAEILDLHSKVIDGDDEDPAEILDLPTKLS